MIIEDTSQSISEHKKIQFVSNGAIVDSWVLTVFFVDSYIKNNPESETILNHCDRISKQQIVCLNTIITNFRIGTFIITPHILAEFLNHLRKYFKDIYVDILTEFNEILNKSTDLPVDKQSIISHQDFCGYLNDISLCIATDKQIAKHNFSCILSFDGRFINAFYKNNDRVLAFNLEALKYYY